MDVCIYGCGDGSQKMWRMERRKKRRKEMRDIFGGKGGVILPGDIVCLITIQGGPVGYVRACG